MFKEMKMLEIGMPGCASRGGGWNESHGRAQRGGRMSDIRVRTSDIRASPKFIRSRDALAPRPLALGHLLGTGTYGLCHPGSRSLEDRGAASSCENHAKEAEPSDSFLCEATKPQSLRGETAVCGGAQAEGAAGAGSAEHTREGVPCRLGIGEGK